MIKSLSYLDEVPGSENSECKMSCFSTLRAEPDPLTSLGERQGRLFTFYLSLIDTQNVLTSMIYVGSMFSTFSALSAFRFHVYPSPPPPPYN